MCKKTYTVNGQEFELRHHGVKGMKWGVRKTRLWGTSRNQPTSARSSVLAGVYAATKSKRVGDALDKSNARDAANWQRAKKEWKQISKNEATLKEARKQDAIRYAKIGGAVVAAGLAVYGAKKISDYRKISNANRNAAQLFARANSRYGW